MKLLVVTASIDFQDSSTGRIDVGRVNLIGGRYQEGKKTKLSVIRGVWE